MASCSNSVSTSTAYGGNNNYVYDIFISHRGPDVKKTLATDLYHRLHRHQLRVFLDIYEMQKGERTNPQIEGAIRTASVQVAIFSPTYAESDWCLNELLSMLDSGSTIIPVFYHVKPSELRWTLGTNGVYAQALRMLEEKKTFDIQTQQEKRRYESDTIAKWRKALSDVSEIFGFHLETYNGNEEQLLEEVVEEVLKKVKRTPLDVSKYPIGLDETVDDLRRIMSLEKQNGQARVIGIVGLGGVGKTTLAKEIFNRERSNYKHSSFLFDIREKPLNSLHTDLLNDLTPLNEQIRSTDEGKEKLRKYLSSKKVLIILDNVDHAEQLDALLLPAKDVLHSSSLIFVTSRNKQVLINSDIAEQSIYKLECLSQQHSEELFCLHAFGQRHPVAGFEGLVKKFKDACGGLPLSLTVLGANLRGNNLTYWTAQLRKLSKILPNDIQSRLKVSYGSLDEEEKQIFVDIACFFIGEDRDTAIRIWDGSGWEGWLGFRNLENRCLVEVDSANCIKMHDHLRDMGRDLAEKEPPGCLRRLWRPTDNLLDLPGQSPVRGINLVQQRSGQSFENTLALGSPFLGLSRLQLVRAEGDCLDRSIFSRVQSPNIIWLCWYSCPYYFLSRWFAMESLRVLHVEGSRLKRLWGERDFQVPLQLRELNIIDAPLSKIPKSIGKLKHLEKFVLHHGCMETLPDEFCHLGCLEHLELKSCSKLKSLPDSFGKLTKLQYIDLSQCKNLQMLPHSFGNLVQLQNLYLNKCYKLTISKETFGKIRKLQCLDLSCCSKIEVLPPQVENNWLLRELILKGTRLREFPRSIRELIHLEVLILDSQRLEMLPPSIGSLRNLQQLELLSSQLKRLPKSIGDLSRLKLLWIQSLKRLECLPESIGYLTSLEELVIWNCTELKCLPSCVKELNNLARLEMEYCGLTELPFRKDEGERGTLAGSTSSELDTASSFKCMLGLKYIKLRGISISEVSFSEGVCPNLQYLKITDCCSLVKVEALPTTLTELVLWNCFSLRKIAVLAQLTRLRVLNVNRCFGLEELQGIEHLTSLKSLNAGHCIELQWLPSLETLKSLERLDTSSCSNLKSIKGLAQLTKLRTLEVATCIQLEELDGVEHSQSLKRLNASACPKLHWDGKIMGQLRQQLKEGLII